MLIPMYGAPQIQTSLTNINQRQIPLDINNELNLPNHINTVKNNSFGTIDRHTINANHISLIADRVVSSKQSTHNR